MHCKRHCSRFPSRTEPRAQDYAFNPRRGPSIKLTGVWRRFSYRLVGVLVLVCVLTGAGFITWHRWELFAVAAGLAVLLVIVRGLRRNCPACGRRRFVRIYGYTAGEDSPLNVTSFGVWQCEACLVREVECQRGVRRLPDQNWHEAARRYATTRYALLEIRRRRAERTLCKSCGYDMRATPERCPECGRVRSAVADSSETRRPD